MISDIELPDGDGYTLVRERLKLRPGTMALALSGYGIERDRERASEAGFSDLLLKPIKIKALETALARVAEAAPSRSARR